MLATVSHDPLRVCDIGSNALCLLSLVIGVVVTYRIGMLLLDAVLPTGITTTRCVCPSS